MKVSVIIPTFNRAYILAEAIQSVLDQTYPHFELIVVDDGSTDNTTDVVNSFRDSRVHLIQHAKNKGVAAARNTGMAGARGDLVSFLDSDDLWDPDKLAMEVRFITGHPEVDAVFTDLTIKGVGATPSVARDCPVFSKYLASTSSCDGMAVPQRTMYLCMLQEMPIRIQATTLRHKAVLDGWKFHEDWRSGEDWEFLVRFARTHCLAFIDRPLVTRRLMSDSTLAQHQKADAFMLTNMFIREKQSVLGDQEATTALRRAIASHSDRLGYLYWEEHEFLNSAKAYVRGFYESGNLKLLAKILSRPIPRSLRNQVTRFTKALL